MLRGVCVEAGLVFNSILPTLFPIVDQDNNVKALMASNVDDLIYGNEPEAEPVMRNIFNNFQVGKEESGALIIFCGKEV